MKIKQIYQKFGIPKNLQQHMLRVAGVVKLISQNWIGKQILDWDLLLKIALLHDLGNVVKFTLEKPNNFGLSGKEVDKLKVLQKEMIEKYGNDDHVVAEKMLDEIGVDALIKETIQAKSFGNSVQLSLSNDWYGKILAYADMRVMPNGVCSLEERLADVVDRMPKYVARSDFKDLCSACLIIEQQIQENLLVELDEIKEENIKVGRVLLEVEL